MTEPILEIKGVSKSYRIKHQGKEEYWRLSETLMALATHPLRTYQNSRMKKERFWALKDINLTVEKGEMFGIIGRNGAGKSTLLKILSHVTYPAEGEVILRGRVGSLLEVGTGFHPELTGRENIFLNGAILGMRKTEIERQFDAIVKFAEIERFLDTTVKRYSSGMYVRLAFAVAAHLDPEILLVDEVLAVGDIQFQKKCLGRMKDVSEGGRTILFVSHNMKMIEALCTRTMLLDEGKMVMVGKTTDVTSHYREMGGGGGEIYRVLTKRMAWKGLANRDRLDELSPDQDIEFWLDFETGAEDVNNVEIEVQLFNDKDVMVLHGKSRFVHELIGSKGNSRFRVRFRFKSPKLAPGRYHLSAIALSGFVYLYVENVDACNVIAKAYFGDAPFLDDVRSVVIPEYSVELDRDPR
jgi:ABC-type polysaccharide/polyol phosphate transport system ATPase subunit